jgi:penicillin-binding protein 1A
LFPPLAIESGRTYISMMRLLRWFGVLVALVFAAAVLAIGGGSYALWHFGRDLPDYQQLANYQPPITTRVHAADGQLIAEFARERRLFVPVAVMPKLVINAFLSAEDKNFFNHPGIDWVGVARAIVQNIGNVAQNRRPAGASTITQQVAKNFLLTNEVSFERKAKEAILAFRIERAFTKEQILELYLNQIYLGSSAYGVAAAALRYFDKSLDQLTLAETAYLAALPKAPNNYHPVRSADRAKARRDWVIDRMLDDGHVTAAEAAEAQATPIVAKGRPENEVARSDWFAEEVRRHLMERYGEKSLYEGGLSVRTTMDPRLQRIGEKALREGLMAYDRRNGWRGPFKRIAVDASWRQRLMEVAPPVGLLENWKLGVILAADGDTARLGFADGFGGRVAGAEWRWTKRRGADASEGPAVGDVVVVEQVPGAPAGTFALRQLPEVGGALVAMDPHTGRVLAMVGGWDFNASQFNRAVQAARQPGSAFKPFVYAAALDNGFTPSSLILDAPFVIDQGPGLGKWKPANYGNEFYGPSTLRVGVEKSRNLMTVRLAQAIGMDRVVDYARRFGIVDDMAPNLSMALGAGETTLLRMTTAYAELVNGGKRVYPSVIDRVQDRTGRTVFRHDNRPCPDCSVSEWRVQEEPEIPDPREQVIDPATAYQLVSILQGAVERGTGVRIREVGRPLAGKTGTTNDSNDAWFVGFAPDLAVGVYVGYDKPKSLGDKETGSSVAVPIFRDFMKEALEGQPIIPFRVPSGIRLVRVQAETGLLAVPGDSPVILEAFKLGTEPTSGQRAVLDGAESIVIEPTGAPSGGRGAMPPPGAGSSSGLY